MVAPCDQWPSSVNAVAFISLVGDIVACKAKKLINNPVVTLLVDFICAARAALGKHDWVEELITAAADLRLEAGWGSEFDPSKVCEDKLALVVSLLDKVFVSSQPPWLRPMKDRAAAKLAEEKDKQRKATDAAATATKKKASTCVGPAPCAGPAPCDGEATQGDAATSVDGQEALAEEDVARDWFVGDIVILKTKLKKYSGQPAQIANVLSQKLDVKRMAGKMEGQSWRCTKDSVTLLMKSTLDPSFSSQPEPEVVQESQQHAEAEVEARQADAELAADLFGADCEQDAV